MNSHGNHPVNKEYVQDNFKERKEEGVIAESVAHVSSIVNSYKNACFSSSTDVKDHEIQESSTIPYEYAQGNVKERKKV